MKKYLIKTTLILSCLGLFTFYASKPVKAAEEEPPCQTVVIQCPNGSLHYCIVCSMEDIEQMKLIHCGGGADV